MEQLDALLIRLAKFRLFTGHMMDQMGLQYVATYAARSGFKVGVIDHTPITLDTIQRTVRDRGARVVGFYVDHENVFPTMSAIDQLKSTDGQLLCVVGGPQASVPPWDERILNESDCDVAVRLEGEVAFTEILNYFLRGEGSLAAIQGITYRADGELKRTPDRPFLQDLDSLPIPDRDLKLFGPVHAGVEYLVTSRGCPHDCAFCYEGRSEAIYRARSISNVLSEVEGLLKDRQPVYINILDDTFTVSPARLLEFCAGMSALRRKYYPVRWFCEGRANVIARHPEMIRAAVDAGLSRIQVGVETGDQKVLDAYRKHLRLDEIRETVRLCAEAGVLSVFGNFIIGGAFETWDTVKASIGFAEELLELGAGHFETSTTLYTPYPGTAMYDCPQDFGLEMLDPDCLTGPGDNYPFVRTEALSKWEILHARQIFLEAISKKMIDLLQRLPYELLVQHCEANYQYRMRTSWFTLIEQIFNYHKYFTLPFMEDYLHLPELPVERFEAYRPVRTVMIGTSHEGKLLLNLPYKKLELNEISSFIYEHAYGKLTNRAIIDRVWRQYYPNEERAVAEQVLREFMTSLDAEKLVVFTLI